MLQLARRFLSAGEEHREVMRWADERARFWTEGRTTNPAPRFNMIEYFRRHLFSILFLSLYQHLGVPKPRRLFYAKINRCLRGIITGADNILDDEYHPMFAFEGLDASPPRYLSILSIMLSQAGLDDALREEEDEGRILREQAIAVKRKLASTMAAIGKEDSAAPRGPRVILTPDEVKANVHESKGAKLLALSLNAAKVIETDLSEAVNAAERGIRMVGMGLQMLDDVVDMREDIAAQKDNYLVSLVHYEGTAAERECLAQELNGRTIADPIDRVYPHAAGRSAKECRQAVLGGLAQLHGARPFLSDREARALLRLLFTVRGAGRLWKASA